MKSVFFILTALSVMGLAFWAYQENYRTQESLRIVDRLQRDIGDRREAIAVLKAEWAYLNRPARLRDLAALNFDRLGLLPLVPEQFARVDEVAFPAPELPAMDLTGTVMTSGTNEEQEP
ncbi:cell division protein FtsL [Oceaniglobus roseus]|uniref:cell division protein FtsL n=1 Tax=Oceaniglobus roseus TaxID=1737570 RepID=UPI000C7F56DC|nr:cell division protein FtsL [Kandeliimicrobium roseum]